jgi:hypothetical protein
MAKCVNYEASYCEAHDYDHVLERAEGRFTSKPGDPGDGTANIRREAIHAFRGLMVAEASDLGLQFIPQTLLVPDRAGQPRRFEMTATDRDERENEVTGWRYADATGLTILVVND